MSEVEQLSNPTPKDIADILNLFRTIPGRTCSAANYLEYLDKNWQDIAFFVCRDEWGTIIGFTQAVRPSLLEPKIGWLPFSSLKPLKSHQTAQDALQMAERWLGAYGATSVRMTSVRASRALERTFGWKLSKERLYEKEITHAV